MIGRHWLVALALLLLTGCAVGPKYKRPPVTVPDGYRGLAPDAGQQTPASLGDEKWWTVFQDQQLQELIREALAQNYDVRIAATRVLQAQAVVGITRADQFPTDRRGRIGQQPALSEDANDICVRDKSPRSQPFAVLGIGFLGKVPQSD